jgi:ubiquinol-cytochrome c reductase cytochrome b subunit
VPHRMNQLGAAGHPIHGSLYRPDPPQEIAALQAARDGEGERGQ